jgi:hypothetical protein
LAEESVSPNQVRQIAERAFTIEQYILRRAWGYCFGIVAVQIALITFLPLLLESAGFSAFYGLEARILVNTTISIIGIAITTWILKKAYNVMLVRREIVDSIWTKMLRPSGVAAGWLVYYVPIILAIVFLRPLAGAVLYGVLATSTAPFLFALKVSFPEQIPREGIAVLVTYAFSTFSILILFLLHAQNVLYLIFLSTLAAVFLSASLYAYKQKPPNSPEDHA